VFGHQLSAGRFWRLFPRKLQPGYLRHRLSLERSFWANRYALWKFLRKGGHNASKCHVIAICQAVHLGDIVACEPVVRHLRRENPGAILIFALQRNYRELVDSHPDIDFVLPILCVSEWARFSKFKCFDEVVDLNIYGRSCSSCKSHWYQSDGSNGVNIWNYYEYGNLLQVYCRTAGIEILSASPLVYPTSEDKNFVDNLKLPEKFVSLHCGSNEVVRTLPAAKWQRIVNYLNERWGIPVVEVGLDPILFLSNDNNNISLCGQLSILQTAEVIRRSELYLGTDSGPAHIANAVGTYGIISLGYYKGFKKYIPYSGGYYKGDSCTLIYHDGPVFEMDDKLIIDAIEQRFCTIFNRAL